MMTNLEMQDALIETVLASCPDLQLRSARLLEHDGELNDILLVNEELIFRFPRRSGSISDFVREIHLLPRLGPKVPLPIPQPLHHSGEVTEPGQVFMGYRRLPGEPLNVDSLKGLAEESQDRMAGQLAQFLLALHHLDPHLLGLELPQLNMPEWTRSFFAEVQQHLFFYMRDDACQAVTDVFEGYFACEDLQSHPCCLTHGDFGGSNILFENDHISGVLDFTGMCISDPALDLASVSTYGERFFVRICQTYPLDESMARRAKFYSSLFALEEAMYGWKNGDEEAFGRGMEQYL